MTNANNVFVKNINRYLFRKLKINYIYIMTINLTGINSNNKNSLTGSISNSKPSYKIDQLKKYILTNYLIPLYSDQWSIIHNNKLLIDETIKQLNFYYKLYKLDEFNLFLELLKIIKILIDKNEILDDLENKRKTYDKNNIINMVYKTTKIRIMPEYEIYNSIIGKPNREKPYDIIIIEDIKNQMIKPNITYDKINKYITDKYMKNADTNI
jgi:hypothetical protein